MCAAEALDMDDISNLLPSLKEIEDAAQLIYGVMPPTPQYNWPLLAKRLGCDLWVKHENHTPTGAFKVRGGLVYMRQLKEKNPDIIGVITATRGNHGQSVAFAAAREGLQSVVVVPEGNCREKNEAMKAFGAELIIHGADFQEAVEYAGQLGKERGLHAMCPFDMTLVKGVSTYALEFFRSHPDLDTIYTSIGMGSGICGIISAREALGLKTKVVGVVSKHAPMMALSFARGEMVEHAASTKIGDGMACRKPAENAFKIIHRYADRIVQVDDDELCDAMRAYYTDTHNIAEGAGAAPLAGLMQEKEKMAGKKVGVILCGQNVESEQFAKILCSTKF